MKGLDKRYRIKYGMSMIEKVLSAERVGKMDYFINEVSKIDFEDGPFR